MDDEIDELGLRILGDFAARVCEIGLWVASRQRWWYSGGCPEVGWCWRVVAVNDLVAQIKGW